MKKMAKNAVLIALIIALIGATVTGCATNRAKTLVLMGTVGAVAAGAAYALTPEGERPEMHAAFGGAVGAAAAGVAGLFIFDEQKKSEELERQAAVMRKELDAFRDEGGGSNEPRLLYETSAPFGKDIPNEYQSLVKPGHWSVYKLNQWVTQGEGTLIHQDRMVKLVPPQLNPKAQNSRISGEGVESPVGTAAVEVAAPMNTDAKNQKGEK